MSALIGIGTCGAAVQAAVKALEPSWTPQKSILPSWGKVWKWYNGRKQTKAAISFNAVVDCYRASRR